MASNVDVLKAIAALEKKHDEQVAQYELDMRGDKKADNGNVGLVGVVRKIRDRQKKNPSVVYLLRNFPIRTIGTIILAIVGVFAIIQILTPETLWAVLAGILY